MPSLDWTRLDSRYVVRDEWFTLRADTYRQRDECLIAPVYIIEYRDWVNAVALTQNQEIVLMPDAARRVRRAGEAGRVAAGGAA